MADGPDPVDGLDADEDAAIGTEVADVDDALPEDDRTGDDLDDDTVEIDLGSLPPPPSATSASSDVAAERDEYKDALLRVKADFDNYKKRVAKEQTERVARAAEGLVTQLLPVLDACEAAVNHGAVEVEPILKSVLDVLVKEGLEVIDDVEAPFDPLRHEAVMHEEGDGAEQVVAVTLRTGYLWKGRVVRPAMVKVRG